MSDGAVERFSILGDRPMGSCLMVVKTGMMFSIPVPGRINDDTYFL